MLQIYTENYTPRSERPHELAIYIDRPFSIGFALAGSRLLPWSGTITGSWYHGFACGISAVAA